MPDLVEGKMEVFCEVLGLQRVCRSLLVYKVSVFPNSPVHRIFKCGVLVQGGVPLASSTE